MEFLSHAASQDLVPSVPLPKQVGVFELVPDPDRVQLRVDGEVVGFFDVLEGRVVLDRFQFEWTRDLARLGGQLFDWMAEARGSQVLFVLVPQMPGYGDYLIDLLVTTGNLPWFQAGFLPARSMDDERMDLALTIDKIRAGQPYDPEDLYLLQERSWQWMKQDLGLLIHQASPVDPDWGPTMKILTDSRLNFGSGRPYTSMRLFQQPWMKVIPAQQLRATSGPQPVIGIDGKTHYLIPVSRYAKSVGGGIYYQELQPGEENLYAGTYYYWEPDSQVYLDMGAKGQFQIFHTKLEAALHVVQDLGEDLDPKRKTELERKIYEVIRPLTSILLDPSGEKDLPSTERLTPEQVIQFMSGQPSEVPLDHAYIDPETGQYEGGELYAIEDKLDQDLAWAVQEIPQLQVLILTNMAGETRAVTEILDVRPRLESLSNLVWAVA